MHWVQQCNMASETITTIFIWMQLDVIFSSTVLWNRGSNYNRKQRWLTCNSEQTFLRPSSQKRCSYRSIISPNTPVQSSKAWHPCYGAKRRSLMPEHWCEAVNLDVRNPRILKTLFITFKYSKNTIALKYRACAHDAISAHPHCGKHWDIGEGHVKHPPRNL